MNRNPDTAGLLRTASCENCGKRGFAGSIGTHRLWCDGSKVAELFWSKVEKTATCWLYRGFIKWDGYGWVNRKGQCMTAHRYAWTLLRGPVPEGMHLLHTCDVPACCNPDHIRLGTHVENMADMKAKGRQNAPGMKKPPIHPDRVRPRRTPL